MVASAKVDSIPADIPATASPSHLNIGSHGPFALSVTATASRAPYNVMTAL